MRKIILISILLFGCNIYSQTLINKFGEREYSDKLEHELLIKVCKNLKIKYSDVNTGKSSSIKYNKKATFFVITYLKEKKADGNYFSTKYLFANSLNGEIIGEINDENLKYMDDEAMQPSKTYIFKKKITLNDKTYGIGLMTEFSSPSSMSLYSKQIFTIVRLNKGKLNRLLYEYPIRKTQGEYNNANRNLEMETLEVTIKSSMNKTNGYFDLLIEKNFSYELSTEEDLINNVKKQNVTKNKTEFQKLIYNGVNYNFEKDENLRFLKW